MLGLELGAIGKLAGLAVAAGGMVSGGLQNIEMKDVADLGGKIAETFQGEKRAALFSGFAKRVEGEVKRAVAERARSPRNRSPEIVAQNLRHALQRFAAGLDKLHVSQADFVAADLDRMKVADRLLDKLAALEPCFREGDENREARPLAHEILRRSFEVATLDKSFLDSLLSAADAELLRRTTGLVLRLDRVEEKVETGFARNDAAHAITLATVQELLVAVRGQVSPEQQASITRETLLPIVEALELAHVPEAQWPGKVMEAVGGLLAKQKEAVAPRNLGGDVDEALREARAVAPDTERAVGILRDRRAAIREEREARARAEAALLKEEADFLSITYRHRDALAALKEAALLSPDDPWLRFRCGDIRRLLGATASALEDFREGGEVARRVGDERSVSASFDRVGDVQMAQGNLHEALRSFRKAHAIGRRLVASDSEIREWQRDLSVSLTKIGDAQDALGRLTEALKHYGQALAIRERLAASDRGNSGWQRDLSVSLINFGDVQVRQGDPTGAMDSFRRALAIREGLAEGDPKNLDWQREILVCHNRIGDVQAVLNEAEAGLGSYLRALVLARRLVASDDANVDWQRDLSVTLANAGHAQVRAGDLAGALASFREDLAIAERLAKSDPDNAGWRRDLSVSFEKIGNVLMEQGDLAEALTTYRRSLEIREELTRFEPGNAIWRRDLSVSLIKLGDVQAKQGDRDEALENFRAARSIREELAAHDRENASWQRDLVIAYTKIAWIGEDACQNWTAAYALVAKLNEEGRLAPSDIWLVEVIEQHRALACG